MKPTLTRPRWRALKKLEAIGTQPFIGSDADLKGPSMVSLEQCGWVQRVTAPEQSTPFAIATQGHHWIVTEAGREAIKALPETQPKRT